MKVKWLLVLLSLMLLEGCSMKSANTMIIESGI